MPPLHVQHDHGEVFYVMSGHVSIQLPLTHRQDPDSAAFAPRAVPAPFPIRTHF